MEVKIEMEDFKKLKQLIIKLLKKDDRIWNEEETELNQTLLLDLVDKIDEKIINLLLQEKETREKFFVKIKDVYVFKTNEFKFFMEENKVDNSYTVYKNKIGLTDGKRFLKDTEDVVLNWPFKDCVLEGGMTKEDQKRNEIFFNEILAKDEIDRLFDAKVLTNFKKYTAKREEKIKDFNRDEKGTIKDNLIIKGNNLLALHSLKKEFAGKVKLIYIDPPYNTGGSAETFTYNNSFNHSTWLTFMKNRLEVAKDFLRDDGFIAMTIDHYELLYLGIIADEVFGKDNRLGIITIVHKPEGRQNDKFFTATNEFMLVYAKDPLIANFNKVAIDEKLKSLFTEKDDFGRFKYKDYLNNDMMDRVSRKNKPNNWYPIYVSPDLKKVSLEEIKGGNPIYPITNNGKEKTWIAIYETTQKRVKNGELKAVKENGKIVIKYKFREQQRLKTHWIDKKYNATASGTNLVKKIIGDKFVSYPKSIYAVIDTLKIMSSKKDIIMDFFAGSGTTGHATLELNKEDNSNRQFILIEQLDTHADVIKKRLKKVLEKDKSKENFIYCELAKWNEQAKEKILVCKNLKELEKLFDTLYEKYFLNYNLKIKEFKEKVIKEAEFKSLSLNEQKKMFLTMLDLNQMYVNKTEMADKKFNISKEDQELTSKFYGGKD
jgi:adenine-specific DNA-methyltransferase